MANPDDLCRTQIGFPPYFHSFSTEFSTVRKIELPWRAIVCYANRTSNACPYEKAVGASIACPLSIYEKFVGAAIGRQQHAGIPRMKDL
jgi:hypothetical protein